MSQVMQRHVILLGVLLLACRAGIGWGQQTDELGPLAPLQKKTEALTQAEQETVTQWIRGQLDALANEIIKPVTKEYSQKRKQERVKHLRDLIVKAAEGADQYRSYYISALAAHVLERLGKQDAQVSINDMIVLRELPDASVAGTYIQALDTTDRSVQFLALKALQAVRGNLAVEAFSTVCPQLVKFARDKADDILLEQVYSFLDNPENQACRDALLELLAWRNSAYLEEPAAPRATDRLLIDAAGRASAQLQEAQRKQIVAALARILTAAAALDAKETVEPATERRRTLLELTVYAAEGALAAITNQNEGRPVTTALAKRDLAAAQDALIRWVGDDKTEGLLNRAPYGLERLAGEKGPPTTQEAAPPS